MVRKRSFLFLMSIFILLACNLPFTLSTETATPEPPIHDQTEQPPESTARPTMPPEPTATTQPAAMEVDRIQVRTISGAAEFYNTGTGEKFIPRGVNYVHFFKDERGVYRDAVMSTADYDPAEVRAAFKHLGEFGYNSVRIFFDPCSWGPDCLTNWEGEGLNPGYLDNMADLMNIAAEEGIYIIFTANAIPDGGQYWAYFDSIFFSTDHTGFEDARNADYLHAAGVETKRKIWTDLLNGLQERNAAFSTVLGWSLTNEYWLWGEAAPFSLGSGTVTTANGRTYDMSDPAQKAQMAVDGTQYFIEEIVSEIKAIDPLALTTMGFYPPAINAERYIMTPQLLPIAPVDFWDFHAYYSSGLSISDTADSYGMAGYVDKPIIMGETAAGYENVPSAASALVNGLDWIAASCEKGFGGWLYWGYYPWPEDLNGKPWAMLEDDELIFKYMSPESQPDPCAVPELPFSNAARGKRVTASNFDPSRPPGNAVDGDITEWNAGGFPPQWIEIDLGVPASINQVGMVVDQWPASITRHHVTARRSDGSIVILGQFDSFTTSLKNLRIHLPSPLADVVAVRITTLESNSFVAWREVDVISWDPAFRSSSGSACVGRISATISLLPDPTAGAIPIASLSAGNYIYIDGFYSDSSGSQWARTGGDAWFDPSNVDLPLDCDPAAIAAAPGPRYVPVRFSVTVPDPSPGQIYLAGTFAGVEFESWIPYMIELSPTRTNTWEVDMLLPAGEEIQYVYTRGSWETIERPSGSCDDTPPRTFTVRDVPDIILEDTVILWRDMGCGG